MQKKKSFSIFCLSDWNYLLFDSRLTFLTDYQLD